LDFCDAGDEQLRARIAVLDGREPPDGKAVARIVIDANACAASR
jgi:hypothetical protein